MSGPVFVVVGHVNRGKSSIVSTLAADETVRVDDRPGTTRHNRAYPMRVGGETLYTLIDTPGFERARHVLAWLREHSRQTSDRRETVSRFVREHTAAGTFPQECELLRPVLDGGAVLYVVDGSVPMSPGCEAETEILRWTGAPRMALINPVGERDFSVDWRPVLDQYFSLVRTFDAHRADFARRLELLTGLRELVDDWRPALDRAIAALRADRGASARESAGLIADSLVDLLTHVEQTRLEAGVDPERHKPELGERFFASLRERELGLRTALRQVYLHTNLEVSQSVGPARDDGGPSDADLFDTDTWSRLGLSRAQLLASGTAAGALAGGVLDAASGGASFLLGTLVGGAAGLASTWWAWGRLAEVRVLGAPLGGALLRIGPLASAEFAWVVLDRALVFWREMAQHAHARREPVDLAAQPGVVGTLDAGVRRRLGALFERLRRHSDSATAEAVRGDLSQAVEQLLETLE